MAWDPSFYECDPPPGALRVPRPTIAQVDAHPDRDFIWAVIMATRLACLQRPRGEYPLRHPMR